MEYAKPLLTMTLIGCWLATSSCSESSVSSDSTNDSGMEMNQPDDDTDDSDAAGGDSPNASGGSGPGPQNGNAGSSGTSTEDAGSEEQHDSGRPESSDDAGSATPDSGTGPVGSADAGNASDSLTANERAAVEAQVFYELEQMGLLASTAKDTAEEHTIVIRLPIPWSFFISDLTCLVDETYPGCRSGATSFNASFAFQTFDPTPTYNYEWNGDVGSLEGTTSFELDGTPSYFLDTNPIEPNDDALVVVRAHVEDVIVSDAGDGELLFEREAEKDFDLIREGEPVRLHHTDLTTLTAVPLPMVGGVDVLAQHYEAVFDALADADVVVSVDVDAEGNAVGSVTLNGEAIATVSGAPFAAPPVALSFDWVGEPAAHDGSSCTPECGPRICGREPACGSDCGSCEAGEQCGPLGQCSAMP